MDKKVTRKMQRVQVIRKMQSLNSKKLQQKKKKKKKQLKKEDKKKKEKHLKKKRNFTKKNIKDTSMKPMPPEMSWMI